MASIADTNPIFKPALRVVTAITNANPCSVTTSFDHGYFSGCIIRINVPGVTVVYDTYYDFGMNEINGLFSSITVTGPATFTMDTIDTTSFSPFSIPAGALQSAQCIPIGETTNTFVSAMFNTLPF